MSMNPLAQKLNDQIANYNPAVLEMLSEKGKNIFFPEKGILAQTAEARGKEINGTIGIALEEDGSPMALAPLKEKVDLPAAKVFPYAPSSGSNDLREAWNKELLRKNPSLRNKKISQPIVTQALTHGLSMAGYLFLNPGENLWVSDLYWGNYNLIFKNGIGAQVKTYKTFDGEGLDLKALKASLMEAEESKLVLVLNFPNNPTGYTLTEVEADSLTMILKEVAESGKNLVVLIDDAYFGLVYEQGIFKESIFTKLCDAHENILAVKIDGATKEDYVWGFRVGFITFGIKNGDGDFYSALEKKLSGAIRGNVSNISNLSQSLLIDLYCDSRYYEEKSKKFDLLETRYKEVKQVLADNPQYEEYFEALPFNSGYFMCLQLKKGDGETMRQHLLREYSVGLIAIGPILRVAFSAVPTAMIGLLFERVFKAAKDLN